MKQLSPIQALGLVLLSSIPFYFGLGAPHLFDWDEVNFAECAREMIVSGDYSTVQIGFEPFWEKPPLFIWLQVLCMHIFGVGELAARLPNALCGTATLFVLFNIGSRLKDYRFGMLWALVYAASFLPHFYFKFGIIDPVFNLFIFLSIYYTILSISDDKKAINNAWYAGLFSGLAVLTKGPVGLLLLMLTFGVYQIATRFRQFPRIGHFTRFALTFSLVVGSWFAINILNNGWDLFWQFINYQVELFTKPVAGHKQPFYYHFVVVLLGCFPMSLLALPAFRSKRFTTKTPLNFRLWMLSLFWVVMILFSITTTKIVHYSSMAYLPLSFLAAAYLYRLEEKKRPINKVLAGFVFGLSLFFAVLFIVVPFVFMQKDSWIGLLHTDPFAQASFSIDVDWPWWISLAGGAMLVLAIFIYINLKNNKIREAILLNTLSTSIAMLMLYFAILPRIEQYTQGPAIEFMKSKAGQKCYLSTYGYKSYANYFYFDYPMPADKMNDDAVYLLEHDMDKPVFLVCKCSNTDLAKNPKAKFMYQKGGFKFYKKRLTDD